MKYLQTYNESILDKMKGPSDEDILKKLEELPFDEKVIAAAKQGFFDILKTTIENSGVLVTKPFIEEVLRAAVRGGNTDILQYLFDKFRFVYTKNFNDDLIKLATDYNNVKVVKMLLERFPDIDITDTDNWLLRVSIMRGNLELVKIFVENGADVNIVNKKLHHHPKGYVLDFATSQGHHDVVDYVKSLL